MKICSSLPIVYMNGKLNNGLSYSFWALVGTVLYSAYLGEHYAHFFILLRIRGCFMKNHNYKKQTDYIERDFKKNRETSWRKIQNIINNGEFVEYDEIIRTSHPDCPILVIDFLIG